MFVSRSIPANHVDQIHDIAYDYYGKRMVTVSSDQMIKVWDLRDDGEWQCTARWRNHLAPIWRVTWAHPEFGQVIATCSFDRSIMIWDEVTGQGIGPGHPSIGGMKTGTGTGSSWIRRANLVDPRTSVTGLQFAPRHLGLQLAGISTDGILRIYEAQDVMNLSQWTLQFDFGTKMTGSCLAWSQSRLDPPLIAVGSSASDPSSPGIEETVEGSGVGSNAAATIASTSEGSGLHSGSRSSLFGPASTAPASSSGSSTPHLVLYEYREPRRHWDLVEEVRQISAPVHDLAFAPHMGQSYHSLAVGASNQVCVLRITPATVASAMANNEASSLTGAISSATKSDSLSLASSGSAVSSNLAGLSTRLGGGLGANGQQYGGAYQISVVARFDQHKGRVWRVSWNITGSILASSGDDGCVRLWQANYLGIWQPIAVITPPTLSGGDLNLPEILAPPTVPPPPPPPSLPPPTSTTSSRASSSQPPGLFTSSSTSQQHHPSLGGHSLSAKTSSVSQPVSTSLSIATNEMASTVTTSLSSPNVKSSNSLTSGQNNFGPSSDLLSSLSTTSQSSTAFMSTSSSVSMPLTPSQQGIRKPSSGLFSAVGHPGGMNSLNLMQPASTSVLPTGSQFPGDLGLLNNVRSNAWR